MQDLAADLGFRREVTDETVVARIVLDLGLEVPVVGDRPPAVGLPA